MPFDGIAVGFSILVQPWVLKGTEENHLKEWLSLPYFKGTNATAATVKIT